ncbi:MAG: hypothetical protein JSR28_18030 [Proteobacteria bacterium]|nr:hypothetical protein [Pseudomonadota bacterium]
MKGWRHIAPIQRKAMNIPAPSPLAGGAALSLLNRWGPGVDLADLAQRFPDRIAGKWPATNGEPIRTRGAYSSRIPAAFEDEIRHFSIYSYFKSPIFTHRIDKVHGFNADA